MPGKPRFDTTALRRLVRQRVDQSSLRAVADEIGVSKSGLDSFLRGREPYSKTRLKFTAWYMRQKHPDGGAISRAEIDAAMALIERYLDAVGTDSVREKRVREVADRLFRSEVVDPLAKKTKDG
jgi:hypothetical protein